MWYSVGLVLIEFRNLAQDITFKYKNIVQESMCNSLIVFYMLLLTINLVSNIDIIIIQKNAKLKSICQICI